MSYIPSDVENERRNRIRLCIFAYAYEFESVSLVSDSMFDEMCLTIRPEIECGTFDKFWKEVFQPDTGFWIRLHPNIEGIRSLYLTHFKE